MRKRFIAGNWKMNMLQGEAGELARSMVQDIGNIAERVDVMIAPPYTSLGAVAEVVRDTKIMLGAQNVFWEDKGAFTGEISPGMIADSGCEWAIVGHSERRIVLGETDEMVRKKIDACLRNGLKVVVCVGETLEQRESGETMEVVKRQTDSALSGLDLKDPGSLVIAYEPVWAIGTGKHATPDQAESVHGTLRKITGNIMGGLAGRIRIVYGGSVNEDNIKMLLAEENIDGALVGGASLKADSMAEIIRTAGD
jgi:triosephosphate isomerase